MKKRNYQNRKVDAEDRSALLQASVEDDERNAAVDMDDLPVDIDDFEDLEWMSPAKDFRSMTVRRKLELRLEELALRRDLEDFPEYRILN